MITEDITEDDFENEKFRMANDGLSRLRSSANESSEPVHLGPGCSRETDTLAGFTIAGRLAHGLRPEVGRDAHGAVGGDEERQSADRPVPNAALQPALCVASFL